MGMNKEAMKGVEAVREKIKNKYFNDNISVSMHQETNVHANRKEGETYFDEDGKEWQIKNGIRSNKTALQGAKIPLFCPKCSKVMGGKEQKMHVHFYQKFSHCFDCHLEFESKLKQEGKYEQWVEDYKMDRWEGTVVDAESEYKEWKKKMLKGGEFQNYSDEGIPLDKEKWDAYPKDHPIFAKMEKEFKESWKKINKYKKEKKKRLNNGK